MMPPPAADDTTVPTASAAATLAASSSPHMIMGTADGAMAAAPLTLTVRRRDDDMAVDPALGATALADASQPSPPAGRQRRSRGPAQAARHAAFLASKQRAAADDAQALTETDARGDDGGGV